MGQFTDKIVVHLVTFWLLMSVFGLFIGSSIYVNADDDHYKPKTDNWWDSFSNTFTFFQDMIFFKNDIVPIEVSYVFLGLAIVTMYIIWVNSPLGKG